MSEHKNPWTQISSSMIYDNAWISLREDKVLNPAGGDGIYGVVHMKNKAIGIIPLDEEGNTWLVGQYRYPLEEYSWEIPMGGGALDVAPVESAKRELKEETGITADDWEMIARIHTSNSVTDEEGFVFVARGLHQGETSFEDTEDIAIRKVQLTEAIDMVMRNEITDSLSVGGLLKLARILKI